MAAKTVAAPTKMSATKGRKVSIQAKPLRSGVIGTDTHPIFVFSESP